MKQRVLFFGTAVIAVTEWLMFELLRTPYRPPVDMLTFLGTEKYGLVAIMFATAVFWVLAVIWIFATTRLTLRECFAFVTLIACLMAVISYIATNLHRPVTPWEMLWA